MDPSTLDSFFVLHESKSLLLIIWSEAPGFRMKFSLFFRRSCRRWINTARGTWFEKLLSILKRWTWNFLHVLVWNTTLFLWIASEWPQVYVPIFLFSECTCSRDGGVSLRFASCHPTVLCDCICRSSSDGVWIAIDAECFSHQLVLLCVFRNACLAMCIHVVLWILYIREHASIYIYFYFGNFLFLKFVQSRPFSSPDGLWPVSFGVPAALQASLSSPSLFEFRRGETVGESERGRLSPLHFLFGSCLNAKCIAKWTLAYGGPTGAVYSLGVVFVAVYLLFPFVFPLLGAPIAGLSSSRFLALKWESLSFCQRCLWTINYNLQWSYFLSPNVVFLSEDLQHVFQFFRLFNLHLVQTPSLCCQSVSNRWSYFVPLCVEGLNVVALQLGFREVSDVQNGFIVATNVEEVVDHPSNLSACKWSFHRLSFAFCCGDLFLEVSCLDFPEPACNDDIIILEVQNWVSSYRCWGNELVNTFSILNFTNPQQSSSGILRRMRDFAFVAYCPTREFCSSSPFVNENYLCFFLVRSSIVRNCHCSFFTFVYW